MIMERNNAYQRWLEWSGAALMCLFMVLFAINLALYGNEDLFARVGSYLGVALSPAHFVITAVMGAVFAPVIPKLTMLDYATRNSFFSLCAAPLLFYTVGVGVYLWQSGGNVLTVIVYLAILLLVVLVGAAIYRPDLRYQRRLTWASVILLSGLMLVAAWGFLARPHGAVFATAQQDFGYPITAAHIGVLSLLSVAGFPLLMTPLLRGAPRWLRRVWFALCVSPMLLYLIPLTHYMIKLQTGVSSAVLLLLLGFVALLGMALER